MFPNEVDFDVPENCSPAKLDLNFKPPMSDISFLTF